MPTAQLRHDYDVFPLQVRQGEVQFVHILSNPPYVPDGHIIEQVMFNKKYESPDTLRHTEQFEAVVHVAHPTGHIVH